MHASAKIDNIKVSVELGKPGSSKNQEHYCNMMIHMETENSEQNKTTILLIRGIVVYRREGKFLLRFPGYRKTQDSKYETAYVILQGRFLDFVREVLKTVDPEKFVPSYTAPTTWSIWQEIEG